MCIIIMMMMMMMIPMVPSDNNLLKNGQLLHFHFQIFPNYHFSVHFTLYIDLILMNDVTFIWK